METLPDDHAIMQYSRCYRLFCGLNIHSVIFVSIDCRKSDHTFTRPNFDDSSVSIHGRLTVQLFYALLQMLSLVEHHIC